MLKSRIVKSVESSFAIMVAFLCSPSQNRAISQSISPSPTGHNSVVIPSLFLYTPKEPDVTI